MESHQIGRLHVHVRARNWKLDALILSDGAVEYHALFRVPGGAIHEPAAVADAFGGNQNALRIQAVEEIAKAASLFADERVERHFEIIEEELRRRVIHHRADRPDRES